MCANNFHLTCSQPKLKTVWKSAGAVLNTFQNMCYLSGEDVTYRHISVEYATGKLFRLGNWGIIAIVWNQREADCIGNKGSKILK